MVALNWGERRTDAGRPSSWLLLGEAPEALILVGGLLCLAGVTLSRSRAGGSRSASVAAGSRGPREPLICHHSTGPRPPLPTGTFPKAAGRPSRAIHSVVGARHVALDITDPAQTAAAAGPRRRDPTGLPAPRVRAAGSPAALHRRAPPWRAPSAARRVGATGSYGGVRTRCRLGDAGPQAAARDGCRRCTCDGRPGTGDCRTSSTWGAVGALQILLIDGIDSTRRSPRRVPYPLSYRNFARGLDRPLSRRLYIHPISSMRRHTAVALRTISRSGTSARNAR